MKLWLALSLLLPMELSCASAPKDQTPAPAATSSLTPLALTKDEIISAIDAVARDFKIPPMVVTFVEVIEYLDKTDWLLEAPETRLPAVFHAYLQAKFRNTCEEDGCFARSYWAGVDLRNTILHFGLETKVKAKQVYRHYPKRVTEQDDIWVYHVATALSVREQGKLIVLDDTSMSPETIDQWLGSPRVSWWETGISTHWDDKRQRPMPGATKTAIIDLTVAQEQRLQTLRSGPSRNLIDSIDDLRLRAEVAKEIIVAANRESKSLRDGLKELLGIKVMPNFSDDALDDQESIIPHRRFKTSRAPVMSLPDIRVPPLRGSTGARSFTPAPGSSVASLPPPPPDRMRGRVTLRSFHEIE